MALIAAHLNADHSGDDSVAIGIYSPSFPTSIPPFSPSLISLMVSVDVKHHVYILTYPHPLPKEEKRKKKKSQSSGAGSKSRWPSWASCP